MNCNGCIKKLYDAYIEHRGCKVLIYEDFSTWMQGSGYEIPDFYDVQILAPGRSKEVTIPVFVGRKNQITTQTLFDHEKPQCLEDGIYCFTVDSCGRTYRINLAYLCSIECRLDQLVAQAKTDEDFETVHQISSYIETIKASARSGMVENAKTLFKVVDNKLKHLTCNC